MTLRRAFAIWNGEAGPMSHNDAVAAASRLEAFIRHRHLTPHAFWLWVCALARR